MAGGIGGLSSFGPGDAEPIGTEAVVDERDVRATACTPGRCACARCRRRNVLASGSHLRGAAGLTAAELIALVWGSGSRGMNAVDLAETRAGPARRRRRLARASAHELQAVPGVGPARAAQLEAAFELGRRLLADWPTGSLADPLAARRRGSARAADGPPRARGAASRAAQHEERRAARRDRLPGQRVSRASCASASCSATPSAGTRRA